MDISLEQQISDKEKELRTRIEDLGIVQRAIYGIRREIAVLKVSIAILEEKKASHMEALSKAKENVSSTESSLRELKNDFWSQRNK